MGQDKGAQRDPDEGLDKPPWAFQKGFLPGWVGAALLVCAVTVPLWLVGSSPPIGISPLDAEGLLHTNAEILATMLAVTLGVTLLGLQFRSQSYTMSGMMEYMNDWVIFGFIIVFICGTAGSMLAAGHLESEYDAGWAVVFATVFTVFSLIYHAGYIFHLVYKLQLSQMLKDNRKKMLESVERMAGAEDSEAATLGKPFEIWEGIMEKAIETDNHAIFKLGISDIFELMRRERYLSIFPIYKEISNYTKNVCKSCMHRGRYRFVDTYVDEMLKTYETISKAEDQLDDDLEKSRSTAKKLMKHKIDDMADIMYGVIDDDEGKTCCKYMAKMTTAVLEKIRVPRHHIQATWASECIDSAIKHGILKDSGAPYVFVDMILKESKDASTGSPKFLISNDVDTGRLMILDKRRLTEWYENLFRTVKRVSIKAADEGEQFLFMNCMVAMMCLCERYEQAADRIYLQDHPGSSVADLPLNLDLIFMFSNFISDAMNILMSRHRYSIVQAFSVELKEDMLEMARIGHSGEYGKAWRRALWVTFGDIMNRAVYADDQRSLSFLVVKKDILRRMIEACEPEEVDVIIEMDFADMGNALRSAIGKHHQSSKDMLIEMYLEMGDMLRDSKNGQSAKYYRAAYDNLSGDIKRFRALWGMKGREITRV
ncbi:MAG: DUF2254 domain-containing protein [Nitrosopumilus sp.]|nr:DUF2254 domain-containing protein [Nitrosopumilus sp.]